MEKYDEELDELESENIEDTKAENRVVEVKTETGSPIKTKKAGEIVQDDYMSLSYYNKVAKGETIKKKWEFTEYYSDEDSDSDETNKKITEITITDKRLILLSDDGDRINKISRNLEDVQGVGYTVKKKTERKTQGKLRISTWAYGLWVLAIVMIWGALIGPKIFEEAGGGFKYCYIISAVALGLSVIFIKKDVVKEFVTQKAYAVTLEFYIKPSQEIQPIGSVVFGKDRSVVTITVPGGETVVSMLAEIDNIITEARFGLSDSSEKPAEINNPTVKTSQKKSKKTSKK